MKRIAKTIIRRLWPRGLVGQLMLVTALALFVAQAIGMHLLLASRTQERMSEISGFAAARIIAATERFERFDDTGEGVGASNRLERRYARNRGRHRGRNRARVRIMIADAPPPQLARDQWPALSQRITELLATSPYDYAEIRSFGGRNALPGSRNSGHAMERRVMLVAARTTDGHWVVLRGSSRQPKWRVPPILIAQTVLLYILLLGPILWIGWRVSLPLKRLSSAAAEPVGLARPTAVEPSGPGDVRDLIDGFNTMRGRIAAMLSDKDRMLGAIGHDLRTPLASLRVRIESVENEALRDRMVDSIDAMTAMLDDILSLARVGRSQEAAVDTDIAALVDAVAQDYRDMDCDVTFDEGDRPILSVRRGLIKRAIRNLTDNALKYGERARLSVVQTGSDVLIQVADDGPGIPTDRIAELMEPFARDESSRNRDTGGSGLGLAIAKAIVDHENGALVLSSGHGRGLEARIVFAESRR